MTGIEENNSSKLNRNAKIMSGKKREMNTFSSVNLDIHFETD